MNKQEFLFGLEMALKRKNVADIPEILSDYNEHFEAGAANGKSEQQIIIELGSVEAIAAEYGEGAGASFTQNFGNITNFFNSAGGAAGGGSAAGVKTGTAKENRKKEEPVIPTMSEYSEYNGKVKYAVYDKASGKKESKSVVSVMLSIIFGFMYVMGGIVIISVSVGLSIAAVAAAISLMLSGGALTISAWFVFGSFMVKLSGVFAGLALIMLGALISNVLFAAIELIKTIFRFVTNLFKKAIKGVN